MQITPELLKINHEDHMKVLNATFLFWFRITTNAGGGGGGGGTIKPASAAGNNLSNAGKELLMQPEGPTNFVDCFNLIGQEAHDVSV